MLFKVIVRGINLQKQKNKLDVSNNIAHKVVFYSPYLFRIHINPENNQTTVAITQNKYILLLHYEKVHPTR